MKFIIYKKKDNEVNNKNWREKMRLFLFECKLLLKNKLYVLYCILFLVLFFLTVQPGQLGKDLKPLDWKHFFVQTLLEDSEKDKIVNTYMLEDLDNLERSQATIVQGGDEEQIRELQEQIACYEANAIKEVTQKVREQLDCLIAQIMPKIGDGKYTKEQLLEMDSDVFQNMEISLSKKELNQVFKQVDKILGGNTYYVTTDAYGNNYQKQCLDLGGYNPDFQWKIRKDGKRGEELSLEEAVNYYEKEVEYFSYSGMFTGFLCDKIGSILCLILCILLATFYLSDQSGIRDIIYRKPVSSCRFILEKYFSMVCMGILPCILALCIGNIALYMRGTSYGYDVNFFRVYPLFFIWILPELLFILSIGMFTILCFDNLLIPFFVEAIFFGLSVDDFYGNYGYSRAVLRYTLIAQSEFWEQSTQAIYENRFFYCCISAMIIGGAIVFYHLKKSGVRFIWLEWIACLKERSKEKGKKMVQFLFVKLGIDETIRAREKKEKGIFYYQWKLGFAKSLLLCVVFDVASYLCFPQDMDRIEYCFRFLVINGIILFSGIGLQEKAGNCTDIVTLHNTKRVRVLQNFFAFVLLSVWNYIFCCSIISPDSGVCFFVTIYGLILGEICTVVSKLKCGVIGGVTASLLVYIVGVISMM